MIFWLLGLALAAPLTVDEVVAAADARVPVLAAAEAKAEGARAAVMAAQGQFDPRLGVGAWTYTGKDPREVANAQLSWPTALGPTLSAGYRVGQGSFPDYDGYWYTLDGGEVRVRVDTPLLDGLGPIARSDVLVARERALAAEAQRDVKLLEVRAKAASSYWKWVATGEKLRIEQELLELAERRAVGLKRQVEQGGRPRIDWIDNERVREERRARVAAAQRDLDQAAVELALWLRTPDGQRRVPAADERPPLEAPTPTSVSLDDWRAVVDRPEVRAASSLRDAARVEQRVARNDLLPKVNGWVQVSQDLGDQPTEIYAGAKADVPVPMRKARGSLGKTTANVDGLDAALRWTEDQVDVQVEQAWLAALAAERRVRFTGASATQAEEAVRLENRAVELGSSDVFKLVLREEKLVKARKDHVDAKLEARLAEVALLAAAGWNAPSADEIPSP